jgi:hypothetical protein
MFESKINRGRANGYAPLDGSGKVPLEKLPPIQSTINTGSFATTGSNTFTGNQIISGSGDTLFTIGDINSPTGPSFGLRVSGSDGVPLFVTSDGTLLIGAITNPTNPSDDASFFANQLDSYPVSDGPTAGIVVQKSGSFQSTWVFDYDGKSYFPSDITIGYNSLGSGLTSGSLNITNGNINLTGSLLMTGSITLNGVTYTSLSGNGGTAGESGTSGVDGTSGESGTSGVDGTSGTSILLDSTLTFDNNIIEGNVFGTTGTQITISQGYTGNVNINSNTIQVTDNEETSAVQAGWIIRFYNGTTQTVLANSVPSGQIYRNIQFEDVVNLIPAYPLTIESPDYQLGSDAFVELKVGEQSIVLGDDGILKLNNGFGEIYADDENYSVRIGTSAENVAPNSQIILGVGNEVLKIKSGPPLREWTFGENGDFNLTGSINGARNLATTGSNQFNGNQTITGSLIHGLEGNLATGDQSHAEGSLTKAIGNYSHAEGDFTQAIGDYSHAEGQETIASGSYSHAEGYQTIALGQRQHVTGQYNFVSPVQSAFIVGNGIDDSNRSNLIYAAENAVEITGSLNVLGNQTISGSFNVSGSTVQSGNNTLTGNTILSGSINISGSTTFNGVHTLSGSNTIIGNTIMTGTNTIIGNTEMSGSIDVSGSSNFHNSIFIVTGSTYFTGSHDVKGNSTITGSLNVTGNLNVTSGSSFYRAGNKLFNYGQWSSLQTQSGSADTAYAMKMESTSPDTSGLYVGSNGSGFPTRIYAENTGLYNIQFSAQLHTTSNESCDFSVWFAMTGSNIDNSNTDFSIEKVSGGGFQVAALNFLTPISSGSYVELYWSKTTANGQLQYKGTQVSPARPATPSLIVTVTQVA